MNISKIMWITAYDIHRDQFIIRGDIPNQDGSIRHCSQWIFYRELRMHGRLAVILRRIQNSLTKGLDRRS